MPKKKDTTEQAAAPVSDDASEDTSLDFDLAFDEASAPAVEARVEDDVPDDVPEDSPDTEEASSDDGEEVENTDPETDEADDVPPEEPKAEAPSEPNPLESKVADLERRLKEKEAAEQKPVEEEKPKSPLSEDDDAALSSMKEDWPEMTRGVEAMMKTFKADMQQEIKQAVASVFQQLQPALKTVESVATNSFLDQLERVHNDAEKVYPQVDAWVDKQPGALGKAYKNILDTGSVEEVAEIFTLFKKATGVPVERKTRERAPAKAASPEKSKKVEQMRTVRRERTGVSAEVDKDDFDGAFEQAARG